MIIRGRILSDPWTAPEPGWIEIAGDRIVAVETGDPPRAAPSNLGDGEAVICPGFVDAHVHLPQFDAVGVDGLDLLEWLDRVVYPAERRWADPTFARRQTAAAYNRLLRAGTLGLAGYLTSHTDSPVAATKVAHRLPLRAITGQVLMDRGGPEELLGHPPARLMRSARGRLITSLNPRFGPGCSESLLAETGRRLGEGFPFTFKQREAGDPTDLLFVQTHLAETASECRRVAELFPDDEHYAGVYDRHGLLGERTLLAHCVHLSVPEWSLIRERDAVVVHCPAANTFLRAGLFDLDAAREHGVRLALGSDVAAGPDVAMPRVARAMIEVAKTRAMTVAPSAHVPAPAEAWDLITRGNADALGWTDGGRLEPGAAADVLILRLPFDLDEHLIGRLLYTWRDEYIAHRIVNGRVVEPAALPRRTGRT